MMVPKLLGHMRYPLLNSGTIMCSIQLLAKLHVENVHHVWSQDVCACTKSLPTRSSGCVSFEHEANKLHFVVTNHMKSKECMNLWVDCPCMSWAKILSKVIGVVHWFY